MIIDVKYTMEVNMNEIIKTNLFQEDNQNIAITVPSGFDLIGLFSRFRKEFPQLLRELPQGENGKYILDMNHPLVRQFISEENKRLKLLLEV